MAKKKKSPQERLDELLGTQNSATSSFAPYSYTQKMRNEQQPLGFETTPMGLLAYQRGRTPLPERTNLIQNIIRSGQSFLGGIRDMGLNPEIVGKQAAEANLEDRRRLRDSPLGFLFGDPDGPIHSEMLYRLGQELPMLFVSGGLSNRLAQGIALSGRIPQLATRMGRLATEGAIDSAIYSFLKAPAAIERGDSDQEILREAALDMAVGAVGGPLLYRGASALGGALGRRVGRGSVPPAGGASNPLEDIMRETQRRYSEGTFAPLNREGRINVLDELFEGAIPREEIEALSNREMRELISSAQPNLTEDFVARRVAQEQGIDLDNLLREQGMTLDDLFRPQQARASADLVTQTIDESFKQSAKETSKTGLGAQLRRLAEKDIDKDIELRLKHLEGTEKGITSRRTRNILATFGFGERILSEMGEHGRRLLAMGRAFENYKAQVLGAVYEKHSDDITRLSKEDWVAARNILHGEMKKEAASPTAQALAERLQETFDEYARAGRIAGFIKGTIRNYFPKIYREAPLAEAVANPDGEVAQSMIAHIIKKKQASTPEEAMNLIRQELEVTRLMRVGFDATALERRGAGMRLSPFFLKHRRLDLPSEFEIDPREAFDIYTREWANSIAAQKVFGGLNLPKAQNELVQISMRSEHAGAQAKLIIAELLGRNLGDRDKELARRGFQRAINALRHFNVIKNLPLAVIPNMSQSAQTATVTNVRSLTRAIRDLIENSDDARKFALRAGALSDATGLAQFADELGDVGGLDSVLQNIASGVLKYTGFNAVEQFNRIVAARAGMFWAEDLFEVMATKRFNKWVGTSEDRIRRIFNSAGVDIDEALARGGLSEQDKLDMARYIVQQTQFPKSILDAPIWSESMVGKLVYQFQRFIGAQSKLIRDQIYKELKQGNIMPLVRFLSLGGIAGTGVMYARNAISGKETPDPMEDPLGFAIEALSWVGAFGIAENVLHSAMYGTGLDRFASIAGVSASNIADMLSVGDAIYPAVGAFQEYAGGGDPMPDIKRAGVNLIDGLLRGFLPSAVGRPLARGDLPAQPILEAIAPEGTRNVQNALRLITQPERYDPDGSLEAERLYRERRADLERAYIESQAYGRPEVLQNMLQKAREDGVIFDRDTISRISESEAVQREILVRQMRATRDKNEKKRLQQRIDFLDRMIEQQKQQRKAPSAVRGLLETGR